MSNNGGGDGGGGRPTKRQKFLPRRRAVGREEIYPRTVALRKVISGGQKGADRAALEEARAHGYATGGMAPPGFITADGADPTLGTRFGLREVTHASSVSEACAMRSKANVDGSDATIVFRTHGSATTDKIIAYCLTGRWSDALVCARTNALVYGEPSGTVEVYDEDDGVHRPCVVVARVCDEDGNIEGATVEAVVDFLRSHPIRTLNVAGHREAVTPNERTYYECVRAVLRACFNKLNDEGKKN